MNNDFVPENLDLLYKAIENATKSEYKKSNKLSIEVFLGFDNDPHIKVKEKMLNKLLDEKVIIKLGRKNYTITKDLPIIPASTKKEIFEYFEQPGKEKYNRDNCHIAIIELDKKKFLAFLKKDYTPKLDFYIKLFNLYCELTNILTKGLSESVPDQELNKEYISTAKKIKNLIGQSVLYLPIEVGYLEPPFTDLYTAKEEVLKKKSSVENEIKIVEAIRDKILHYVDFYNIENKKIELPSDQKMTSRAIAEYKNKILKFKGESFDFRDESQEKHAELLNALFKTPGKSVSYSDMWFNLNPNNDPSEYTDNKKKILLSFYQAGERINSKVASKTTITDLIVKNTKSAKINPNYLPQ